VMIGKPFEGEDGIWASPVAAEGLFGRLTDIRGSGSLQALCLAISLARKLLEDFIGRGGKVLHPQDRVEWSREDLAPIFGDLARH